MQCFRWSVIGLLAIFPLFGDRDAMADESQEPMAETLWPNGAPGGGAPQITTFLAASDKANGTATPPARQMPHCVAT